MEESIAKPASSSPPSSPLSMLSRSPTPPSSLPVLDPSKRYPSPSATSGSASPRKLPDSDASEDRTRGDGPPPAKRRRVQPRPRMTRHVDLECPAPNAEEELGHLLRALQKKKKIVVIAGAGISVSAGIPDFRSSTGLFTTLRGQHGLRGSGKHLFDASVYKHDSSTSSFHSMVRELADMTQLARPTPFHHMLASIASEGRLMRLYSQNVDCIDTKMEPLATNVPLNVKGPWPATIQLHGGLAKMVCSKCGQLEEFDGSLFDGPEPPPCQQCAELDQVRTSVAGKRSHGIGRLRPRIVLYNEYNPDEEAIGNVSKADLRRGADAVIVVGTSLKIPGVRRLVKELCQVTRSRRDGFTAWINIDSEPQGVEFKDCWDLVVRGNSDDVAMLAGLPHWDEPDIGSPSTWKVTGEEMHAHEELEVVLGARPAEPANKLSPVSTPKIKVEEDETKARSKISKPKPILTLSSFIKSKKAQNTSLQVSSPTAAIPTPIQSPKPQRKRLPDKPSARQGTLPFQQVKKSDSKESLFPEGKKEAAKPKDHPGKLSAKPSTKPRSALPTGKPNVKSDSTGKPRKPRQQKPKKDAKPLPKSLALNFRSTKHIPDATTTTKGSSKADSLISLNTSRHSSPATTKRLRSPTAEMVKLPSLREPSHKIVGKENNGGNRGFCTPPPGSPELEAREHATISPESKPRGMAALID